LAVWVPGAARVLENELVMIEPSGAIAWHYRKSHPVPGEEAAMSAPSDGRLRILDTPFGRLSAAICFDADFPQTLRQAGLLNADIVLNPSNEWAAIDPWHTQMASLRAIEEGTSVVHQASHGLSAAFDYQGNRLAAVDYFRSDGASMIADVPTRGVRTLYSRLGDWFAWLCCVALVALIITALGRGAPAELDSAGATVIMGSSACGRSRHDSIAQALATGGGRSEPALVCAAASAPPSMALARDRRSRALCPRSGQFRASFRGTGGRPHPRPAAPAPDGPAPADRDQDGIRRLLAAPVETHRPGAVALTMRHHGPTMLRPFD